MNRRKTRENIFEDTSLNFKCSLKKSVQFSFHQIMKEKSMIGFN